MTLNASELSRLGSIGWSESRGVVGRGAGSWLRARRSRGEEEDEGDRGAGEDEASVAVLWRGMELGWGTSMVEEEDPTEAGPGTSVSLAAESPFFALPFWSVAAAFDSCGVGADGTRARDVPLSCDSSCSGWSRNISPCGLACLSTALVEGPSLV